MWEKPFEHNFSQCLFRSFRIRQFCQLFHRFFRSSWFWSGWYLLEQQRIIPSARLLSHRISQNDRANWRDRWKRRSITVVQFPFFFEIKVLSFCEWVFLHTRGGNRPQPENAIVLWIIVFIVAG
jgi:hypothetical protein